eukprot:gnl/TRDRNA2_/TRDRNA2_158967_c0_seq1.p1 gnl/TRDRNA2_/TRDRNA2_158967_c0~~gnl/TRDRNA2_/TRDRNA2_158967_c0_seq1.p1  ORF type:complete len:660 (-),score=101.95 gnl/TRDRNA2_/TRDRNA2_158967_c0_seq1:135-2003(-)
MEASPESTVQNRATKPAGLGEEPADRPCGDTALKVFLDSLGLGGFETALLQVTGLRPCPLEFARHVEEEDLAELVGPDVAMKKPQLRKLMAALQLLRTKFVAASLAEVSAPSGNKSSIAKGHAAVDLAGPPSAAEANSAEDTTKCEVTEAEAETPAETVAAQPLGIERAQTKMPPSAVGMQASNDGATGQDSQQQSRAEMLRERLLAVRVAKALSTAEVAKQRGPPPATELGGLAMGACGQCPAFLGDQAVKLSTARNRARSRSRSRSAPLLRSVPRSRDSPSSRSSSLESVSSCSHRSKSRSSSRGRPLRPPAERQPGLDKSMLSDTLAGARKVFTAAAAAAVSASGQEIGKPLAVKRAASAALTLKNAKALRTTPGAQEANASHMHKEDDHVLGPLVTPKHSEHCERCDSEHIPNKANALAPVAASHPKAPTSDKATREAAEAAQMLVEIPGGNAKPRKGAETPLKMFSRLAEAYQSQNGRSLTAAFGNHPLKVLATMRRNNVRSRGLSEGCASSLHVDQVAQQTSDVHAAVSASLGASRPVTDKAHASANEPFYAHTTSKRCKNDNEKENTVTNENMAQSYEANSEEGAGKGQGSSVDPWGDNWQGKAAPPKRAQESEQ